MDRPVIALDAMGGDHAPDAVIAGALRAHDAWGAAVCLVGQADVLAASLTRLGRPEALPIVAATEVVGMSEDPALALRAKPDASVRVAVNMVAEGRAAAALSAGSTGATLAAGLFGLGRAPGVRRPAVAALLPFGPRGVVLVDAGANADVTADVLASFAAMGQAYAQTLGGAQPRVGLLNIGAEPGKGNTLAKEAFAVLSDTLGGAFSGNVEPAEVVAGAVDVVVSDGFTGNVFLKTVEALGVPHGPDGPAQAGAAALLGVNGNVLVAHGAADAEEIAAALATADRVAVENLAGRVAQMLAQAGQEGRA